MFVKALTRLLGKAQWRLDGDTLADLTIITPDVAKPTQDQVNAEIAKIKAEESASKQAQEEADHEILTNALGGMSYKELSTWIDAQLKLPGKYDAAVAINALKVDNATKSVLITIANAVIDEAAILKAVARALVAALRKAGYIK